MIPTKYEKDRKTLDKIINGFGIKGVTSTEINSEEHLPSLLPQAKIKLLANNEFTNVAKNYRSIACLNLM